MVPLYHTPRSRSAGPDRCRGPELRKSARNAAYWLAPTIVVDATVRANNRKWSHTRSWNLYRGCQTATGVGSKLADVLEVFARLEADSATRRDAHFLAGARVTADAALTGLHLEYAESAQFDTLAALHGGSHRIENRVDCHLGFDLGDVRDFRNLVDDVD